jgi:hypothetical protein
MDRNSKGDLGGGGDSLERSRGKTVGDTKGLIEIEGQRRKQKGEDRRRQEKRAEGEQRTGKRHREKQKDCTGGDNEEARG